MCRCGAAGYSVFMLSVKPKLEQAFNQLCSDVVLHIRVIILAGFSVGMMISFSSFAAMLLVMELESFFLTGNLLLPAASWLAIMLLIAPAISLVAIAVTVRSSAKAQTIEEAQQRAVFLIFPILALLIGQFTGIILISAGLPWGVGIVLAALAILLVKRAAGNFTYEKLLK